MNNNKLFYCKNKKENFGIVLDTYYPSYFTLYQIAQVIGNENFTLLEIIIKDRSIVNIGDKLNIGKEKEDWIYKKIKFEDLTATSRIEIDYTIKEIISSHENNYLKFFNTITENNDNFRKLKSVSKINSENIKNLVKAREKTHFKSFDDLEKRVPYFLNPTEIIIEIIKNEILEFEKVKSKYYNTSFKNKKSKKSIKNKKNKKSKKSIKNKKFKKHSPDEFKPINAYEKLKSKKLKNVKKPKNHAKIKEEYDNNKKNITISKTKPNEGKDKHNRITNDFLRSRREKLK